MANPTEAALSPSGRHTPSIGLFERVPVVAGSTVAVLSALVLVGWAFNVPIVASWKAGGILTIPLTALCFVLAGCSLAIAVRPHRSASTEAVQQTLAALVATIAILTLYEYLRGSGSRFNLSLFGNQVDRTPWSPYGPIAMNSAGSLLMYSIALLFIPHDQRKRDLRAQMFATPALFVA